MVLNSISFKNTDDFVFLLFLAYDVRITHMFCHITAVEMAMPFSKDCKSTGRLHT